MCSQEHATALLPMGKLVEFREKAGPMKPAERRTKDLMADQENTNEGRK
jgi:hypothetical protein